LLITSKHSIGPLTKRLSQATAKKDELFLSSREDARSELSHAEAGEKWLRKYLENKGKTEADLATRLWESNLTAVAEVIFFFFLIFEKITPSKYLFTRLFFFFF
jgi:tRNA ligase